MCNDNGVDLEKTEEHHDHTCHHEWYPWHLAVLFNMYENRKVSGSKCLRDVNLNVERWTVKRRIEIYVVVFERTRGCRQARMLQWEQKSIIGLEQEE